ncbi:MAG TPA: hypothetical protein PKE55_01650 [Kiritimatiellia bacterium]|nr:hypothetical protein [Kiritimatiellia bacterium]
MKHLIHPTIVPLLLITVLLAGCAAPPPPRPPQPIVPVFDNIMVSFAEPVGSELRYFGRNYRFPAIVPLNPNLGPQPIQIAVKLPSNLPAGAIPGDVKLNNARTHLLIRGTIDVMKVSLSETDKLARYRFVLSPAEIRKLINGEVLRKWHYSAEGKRLYVIELGLE